jgi:hypothetical protein
VDGTNVVTVWRVLPTSTSYGSFRNIAGCPAAVEDGKEAKVLSGSDGMPLQSVSGNSAWSVYTLDLYTKSITQYVECRKDAGGIFFILWSSDVEHYNQSINLAESVLDTLKLTSPATPAP